MSGLFDLIGTALGRFLPAHSTDWERTPFCEKHKHPKALNLAKPTEYICPDCDREQEAVRREQARLAWLRKEFPHPGDLGREVNRVMQQRRQEQRMRFVYSFIPTDPMSLDDLPPALREPTQTTDPLPARDIQYASTSDPLNDSLILWPDDREEDETTEKRPAVRRNQPFTMHYIPVVHSQSTGENERLKEQQG